jgi:hypothetical protein
MPEVGLPVSYERTDRTEDVYQVVEKVAPMQPDVPDAAHAPPGSVVLEADDPASQAAY